MLFNEEVFAKGKVLIETLRSGAVHTHLFVLFMEDFAFMQNIAIFIDFQNYWGKKPKKCNFNFIE